MSLRTCALVLAAWACSEQAEPVGSKRHLIPVSEEEARHSQIRNGLLNLLKLYSHAPEPRLATAIWFLSDKLCNTEQESLDKIPIGELWDLASMDEASFMGGCGFVVMRDGATRCGSHFLRGNYCVNKPGHM